jgi:AraC-like DNA-binding protein
MDENFLTISGIGEVALASNLSEFHFFRSFKQAFGSTTYQYILNKRLELARAMLENHEIPITEIAATCNFPDLFTFSKAFKRHFGIAPSQFQKSRI